MLVVRETVIPDKLREIIEEGDFTVDIAFRCDGDILVIHGSSKYEHMYCATVSFRETTDGWKAVMPGSRPEVDEFLDMMADYCHHTLYLESMVVLEDRRNGHGKQDPTSR